MFATIFNIEGNNCLTKINSLAIENKINKTNQQQQQPTTGYSKSKCKRKKGVI